MPIAPRGRIETYQDLATAVDQHGGVVGTDMGTLRDIHGAGKLGTTVVVGIHDQLESHGLGHVPIDLPTYQWERALVYRKGTPVARVIDAITAVTDRSDAILREQIGKSAEANTILQKIREMVCE